MSVMANQQRPIGCRRPERYNQNTFGFAQTHVRQCCSSYTDWWNKQTELSCPIVGECIYPFWVGTIEQGIEAINFLVVIIGETVYCEGKIFGLGAGRTSLAIANHLCRWGQLRVKRHPRLDSCLWGPILFQGWCHCADKGEKYPWHYDAIQVSCCRRQWCARRFDCQPLISPLNARSLEENSGEHEKQPQAPEMYYDFSFNHRTTTGEPFLDH